MTDTEVQEFAKKVKMMRDAQKMAWKTREPKWYEFKVKMELLVDNQVKKTLQEMKA